MYYTSNFKIPSLNNSRFGNFVDLIELEIKDTTGTDRSASFLDLHLKIDSEGRLNSGSERKLMQLIVEDDRK
jgi:hypothetical protein